MSQQIFVSHSRYDTELLDELDSVFGKSESKQYRASFEDQFPPVSENIKKEIDNSRAMFVVLGPEAQKKEHTKIWIGWEVGIAIQQNMPVWIIEDIESDVEMPIPDFTDYLIWSSEDKDRKRTMRDVIESEFGLKEKTNSPSWWETKQQQDPERNKDLRKDIQLKFQPAELVCPYDDCGVNFTIWFFPVEISEINCPACRKSFDLTDSPIIPIHEDGFGEKDEPFMNLNSGTTVKWENKDSQAHGIKAIKKNSMAEEWVFETEIESGGTVAYTFSDEGIYEYQCTKHDSEKCAILIEQGNDFPDDYDPSLLT